MDRLALPVQTLFAELVERAHMGQLASAFDPAGQFIEKTISGRPYWYFRTPMSQGVRKDRYVGADSPELRHAIEQHRMAKDDYKQRRALVSALTGAGLKGPDAMTGRVLEALANAGVFRLRALVVGTAAYQTYSGLLGIRLPSANAMTEDLDIAQFRTVSVAVDDAIDSRFLDILKTVDPGFQPVQEVFERSHASHFALGNRYRVDILTPNRGADSDELVELPALRSYAQPLRFLDFLIYQEVRSVALYGVGVPVNVPAPERYALHKLIVSRMRIQTSESQAKSRKDLRQAADLLDILIEQRPYELKDLWEELQERGPKWRRLAGEALSLTEAETGSSAIRERFEQLVGDRSD